MSLIAPRGTPSTPIHALPVSSAAPLSFLSETAKLFLATTGFRLGAGKHAIAPSAGGDIEAVVFGIDETKEARDPLAFGRLMTVLPAGVYHFATEPDDPELASLAFLMSGYRFTRYKANSSAQPQLVLPPSVDRKRIEAMLGAIAFGRDLINTPAGDLPPEALGQAALDLAKRFKAKAKIIIGDALIDQRFPMVHAVGRAAGQGSKRQAPRLVDFVWGPKDGLAVTLVGKGVCFDTGGLNIKPESAMLLMKKDMGGAAIALTTAQMIMALNLPVRLRVILPIVENAISGDAFRPGDVLASRKGISVEIGNTDAEGRLILGDALTLACEDPPEMLIDYATLTGAARVA
jgi:leucyl aminopeptidase